MLHLITHIFLDLRLNVDFTRFSQAEEAHMTRYSATEAIVLPRMTAIGAKTLGTQLIAAAEPFKVGKKLPKIVNKALTSFASKHNALSTTLRDQVEPSPQGTLDPVQCDRTEDACWSGLNGFLEAIAKLSWLPIAEEAAEIRRLVFDGGLRFVQLPYMLQWSESETRLARIHENALRPRIENLGGKIYLDELDKAHTAYGKALGITAPLPATMGEDGPVVRAALEAFGDALRKYVVKVMGMVEDDEPETQEIAATLLAPIDAWDEVSTAKAPEPAPIAPTGPGEG
jgi:hypothetical protein